MPPPPPPPTAPSSPIQGVTVTVIYEMYSGLPAYAKWVVVTANNSTGRVTIGAMTTDLLYTTNEAVGYWPTGEIPKIKA